MRRFALGKFWIENVCHDPRRELSKLVPRSICSPLVFCIERGFQLSQTLLKLRLSFDCLHRTLLSSEDRLHQLNCCQLQINIFGKRLHALRHFVGGFQPS